jgi:hypothetical protein
LTKTALMGSSSVLPSFTAYLSSITTSWKKVAH